MKSVISKVVVAIGLLAVTGCSKEKASPGQPVTPNQAVDVYVGGISGTTGNAPEVATWWKNGEIHTTLDTLSNASASSIAVSGKDVYLAGVAQYKLDQFATYWKNGIAVQLSNVESYANAISVSNGSVYVVGEAAMPNNYMGLAYWKNGVFTNVSNEAGAHGSSITVNGSDVYIAGVSDNLATYWKNGIINVVGAGSTLSYANAITVSGGDVYVAGTIGPTISAVPTYWKNGIAHRLATAANSGQVTGIAVSGSDVYVSGYVIVNHIMYNTSQAVYWKNGVVTALSNGTSDIFATAIAVNGADVYVVGFADDGNPPVPMLWKNGVATKLANYGIASALVLVPK